MSKPDMTQRPDAIQIVLDDMQGCKGDAMIIEASAHSQEQFFGRGKNLHPKALRTEQFRDRLTKGGSVIDHTNREFDLFHGSSEVLKAN